MPKGKVYENFMSQWFVIDVDNNNMYYLSTVGCPSYAGDLIEYVKSSKDIQDHFQCDDHEFVDCVKVVKTKAEFYWERKQFETEINDSPITHKVIVKDSNYNILLLLGCVKKDNKLYAKCDTGHCPVIYNFENNKYLSYGRFHLEKYFCIIETL